jgi:hypothetical protein
VGCWWITGGIVPDHSIIGRFIHRHDELLTTTFLEQCHCTKSRDGRRIRRYALHAMAYNLSRAMVPWHLAWALDRIAFAAIAEKNHGMVHRLYRVPNLAI